ncbi:MAG: hypothetical protein AAGI51_01615 [Pseudomonadota bacterium]
MTLIICLILLIPLGIYLPKLAAERMPTTLGVILGAGAALLLGAGLVYGVAQVLAAVAGADAKLAFESGFNAWKLLIFVAPAAGIHYRRQAAKGAEAGSAGDAAEGDAVKGDAVKGDGA